MSTEKEARLGTVTKARDVFINVGLGTLFLGVMRLGQLVEDAKTEVWYRRGIPFEEDVSGAQTLMAPGITRYRKLDR